MGSRIAVLGAGSWGTALAQVQAEIGHEVHIWDRDQEVLDSIAKTGINQRYHPEIKLHPRLKVSASDTQAISKADLVVLATPSHAVRDALSKLAHQLPSSSLLINVAKGVEVDSHKIVSEIATEILGSKFVQSRYATLSGPSFAFEVIRGRPTGVTVSSYGVEAAKKVQELCHSDCFRIFTSPDVIGVELAGALKNVVAIAVGASDGLGFGLNARATLMTRGLVEISRIGSELGAQPLTFLGLSGMGDLILTCTGDLSRNRRIGLKLSQGLSLRQAMKELGQVAEGIRTAKAAHHLIESLSVEAPILRETYLALYKGKPLSDAIRTLLEAAPEAEHDH